MSRTLDTAGRMTGLTVQGPAGQAFSVGYGHASGRLQSVSGPAGTFSYGYLAPVVGGETHGSRRWTTLTRPGGGVIEQQYVDPLRRLTRTELRHSNGTVLNRHDYGYDLRSQRTSHTRAGTHYATSGTYAYDDLGQLTGSTADSLS